MSPKVVRNVLEKKKLPGGEPPPICRCSAHNLVTVLTELSCLLKLVQTVFRNSLAAAQKAARLYYEDEVPQGVQKAPNGTHIRRTGPVILGFRMKTRVG
jgi:hypothetical protein